MRITWNIFNCTAREGTDFRPAFEYVEELRQNREFTDLKGMIYFTGRIRDISGENAGVADRVLFFWKRDYRDAECAAVGDQTDFKRTRSFRLQP